MKTLFIECNTGAAGDMLMSALLEIAPENAEDALNNLTIPGVTYHVHKEERTGVHGTSIHVLVNGEEEGAGHDSHEYHHHDHDHHDHEHNHDHHDHEYEHAHHHHNMASIKSIINTQPIPDTVKKDALDVYKRIADAESRVHGKPVEEVHFHEVGALDAIADIVGCCLLMHMIAPDEVIVSPINIGSGTVHCAHGILPVPAPATALILQDAVSYSDGTKSELCTPTGAAVLTHFATNYSDHPQMMTDAIGIGLGKRDIPGRLNAVRIFLGTRTDRSDINHSVSSVTGIEASKTAFDHDIVTELITNIDDMTGEELAYAMNQLLNEGALDVFHTPIIMKKGRPAVMLTCLVKLEDESRLTESIFRLTTTLGVRSRTMQRTILPRQSGNTASGAAVKTSGTDQLKREKIEYDDAADYAKAHGISLREARKALEDSTDE